MKKILVIAIIVLFSLVGFNQASAQNSKGSPAGVPVLIQNYAGPLTNLNLSVVYQEGIPETAAHSDGRKLVRVAPKIVKNYDPVLYFYMDLDGALTEVEISWVNPTGASNYGPFNGNSTTRIWTISCTGGNMFAPTPNLPDAENGLISSKSPLSLKKLPAKATNSAAAVFSCWFCPDGFQYDKSGSSTGVCNSGASYVSGTMYFQGTAVEDITGTPSSFKRTVASFSVKGTVAGAGFDYLGEEWNTEDCLTSVDFPTCKALFDGSFGAKLTPCSGLDPNCLTVQ